MNALRSCSKLLLRTQALKCTQFIERRSIHRYVAPVQKELTKRKKQSRNPVKPIRSTFSDWNFEAELYAFNNRLSEKFETDLLQQSFTFKSYIFQEEERQKELGIQDPKLDIQHNEELVEEGRLITSKVVEIYLSTALPRCPQECIFALHDYLLSDSQLAYVSEHIGTKDIILSSTYPPTVKDLADVFLALVSALSRSVDEAQAGRFVRDFLIALLAEKDLTEIWCPAEPLVLLERVLANENRAPSESRLIGHTGDNTVTPVFRVGIYSNKEYLGSGFGESIEEAQKIAALNILYRMFGLLDSSQPIRFNLDVNECLLKGASNPSISQWNQSSVSS